MACAWASRVASSQQATCCSSRVAPPRAPTARKLRQQQAGRPCLPTRCIRAAASKSEQDAPPTPAARDEEAYYQQMKKEMEGSSIWESEFVSTALKALLIAVVFAVGAVITHLGQPVIDNTINSFPHIE